MTPELITNWADHDCHMQKILPLAERRLRIFDEDLSKLRLERPEIALFLRRFLATGPHTTLQIVLRNPAPLRHGSPRIMTLLGDYPNSMYVYECAPQLASLNDSMLIVDDSHALIRFHTDQVRSKSIMDNPRECRSYILRFEEILKEGGTPVSATTLGL